MSKRLDPHFYDSIQDSRLREMILRHALLMSHVRTIFGTFDYEKKSYVMSHESNLKVVKIKENFDPFRGMK